MIENNSKIRNFFMNSAKEIGLFFIFWIVVSPFYPMADRLMGDNIFSIAVSFLLIVVTIGLGGGFLIALFLAVLSVLLTRAFQKLYIHSGKYDLAICYCFIMTAFTIFRADIVWEYYITAMVCALALMTMGWSTVARSRFLAILILIAI